MADARLLATAETYRAAVLAAKFAADILAQHDIPQLLQDIGRAEALGPILNPTLYRDKSKAMAEDRELLSAAVALRKFGCAP